LLSERQTSRLQDRLENIARIERFTAGFDEAAFTADEKSMFAVFHALPIISEAARRLGSDAETSAPEQRGQSIRAFGNVLRHQCDEVGPGATRRIVRDDLPSLKQSIERVLGGPPVD
jgi:uncharacterized protein with HEPN domain